MLQITPKALQLLRATHEAQLARVRKTHNTVRRLNRDRQRYFVSLAVRIIRTARNEDRIPTLLNFEAALRHGFRTRLCLEGWNWHNADATAAEIVASALRQLGAKRPSWAEGQPEWAQNGAGALIERTRCIRCHSPLPEMHTKFCSHLCANAHSMTINRIKRAAEDVAYDLVVAAKQRDFHSHED